MASANSFLCLWRNKDIRTEILSQLDIPSLCALRLTNSEVRRHTTRSLFNRTHLTFTPSALTRPARIESLARVGAYIQHLIFFMPHSEATFLAPLINRSTGEEIPFLYTPHKTVSSGLYRPRYGTDELGTILTKQYPPIFHAATNVPAFIRFLRHLPNLRHLTISTPCQDPKYRYRRSSVDYALISLRIAIETVSLPNLQKLTLQVHPSALLYLRAQAAFGGSPRAPRKWSQIRKLNISIDAWDFYGSQPGLDQLKLLDDYIRPFSQNLEKFSFAWSGTKGPSPINLSSDPLFAPKITQRKLFAEITTPMSPLPSVPARKQIHFPKLKRLQIRNAAMSTNQVSDLVYAHRHTVREFDFKNVLLTNEGLWEEALEPLTRISGSDCWKSQHSMNESFKSAASHIDASEVREDMTGEVIGSLEPQETIQDPAVMTTTVKRKRLRRRRRRKNKADDAMDISEPLMGIPNHGRTIPIQPPPPPPPPPVQSPTQQLPSPRIPSAPRLSNLPTPSSSTFSLPSLQPKTYTPAPFTLDPHIQGVQRNISHDEAQIGFAEDPIRRTSALKKAKEAVLLKLGKEFYRPGQDCAARGLFGCKSRVGLGAAGDENFRKPGLGGISRSELVPILFSRC
jgi:hypothetical protein